VLRSRDLKQRPPLSNGVSSSPVCCCREDGKSCSLGAHHEGYVNRAPILAVLAGVGRSAPAESSGTIRFLPRAAFSANVEQGVVPGDAQGLTGKAKAEAAYLQAFGTDIYDRDANAFFEASFTCAML
jgi:hypothetical protein